MLVTALCAAASAQAQTSTVTQTMMLTGSGKDDPVTWNFECTGPAGGQNLGVETTIGVPSNWELQGFGTYNYGTSSPRSSDVGQYSYTFNVPASWAGQDVQLVFEGVMTDAAVTLNGTSAGTTHQGGFTQFRYDVTSILNYGGSNTIAVTDSESSANTSVNSAERQADYWNFGGIYRPVYLECRPAQSIQRVAINALASGSFTAFVTLNSATAGETLTGFIQTLAGQQVGPSFSTTLTSAMIASGTGTLSTMATGISPWNPESPTLYQLVAQLSNGPTLLHSYTQKFGFRTVQVIAGSGIFINGVKIRLKGVDRHTFWPSSGRTSSPSLSGSVVALMQAANINAVRMSHYPPDQHFLDAADAAGLMILDELPGWQHYYDTPTASRMVSEMVPRDVNHPSIIIWDNGNEGGWNIAVDGSFAVYDPQGRNVNHPGDGANFNGIRDDHYPTYNNLAGDVSNASYCFMPSEFLHALFDGGGAAGLQDYLNFFEASPRSAGGIIWSWDDEGVVRVDEGGIIDTNGNQAPDGIVGPYWQPEPSYYAVRDIWSPVTVPVSPIASGSTVLSSTFNGQVGVYNDYFFTSLSACTFTWQLEDFPLLATGTSTGPIVSSSGSLAGPAVAPQTTGTLQLNLPGGWATHGALQLSAYNSNGQFLTTWTWPIQSQAAMESANLPAASGSATAVTSGTAIVLSGSTTQVAISTATGLISSVVANGYPVSLTNGPSLASGSGTLTSIGVAQSGSNQVVTANFSGNLQTITYTMRGDGWMKVVPAFTLTGTQAYIGVTFTYPEANVQGFRWLGNGPEPVFANRLAGVSYSVWSKTPNVEIPGFSWAFAPVFAGYHGNLQWASIQTTEQPINIIAETPGLYLRLNTPGTGVTPVTAVAAIPPGNISLLEAISPIGSKTAAPSASTMGPMSAPAVATGTYQSAFWMNFGSYDTLPPVAPQITGVDAASPGRVTVTFSAPMSAQALNPAAYTLSPALNVYAVTQGPGNSVILDVEPLTTGSSYTLSVASVAGLDDADLAGTTSFPISYNSGLALCLPFDTETSGVSPDTSGNGRNATLTGVTLGPGYSGSAAVLTGSAGSIATATLPAMTQYTIAAWINMAGPGNSSFPRIVSMDNEGVEFYVAISGGLAQGLGFQASGVDVWRSAVNLLPAYGNWAHVAVSYSGTGSTPAFYLNGSLIATGAPGTASGTYGTAGLAGIGNRTSDGLRGFDGSIDQLEIYNRVLTPAEIAGLAALPPTESFAQWMGSYGLSGSNPTVAYDKDGVPGLVKYVLALDPAFSAPSPLQLSIASGNLSLIFPVAGDAEGVTLSVQTNTSLNPNGWTTLPSSSLTPWRVLSNATEYQVLVPIESAEQFFRLQVTSP